MFVCLLLYMRIIHYIVLEQIKQSLAYDRPADKVSRETVALYTALIHKSKTSSVQVHHKQGGQTDTKSLKAVINVILIIVCITMDASHSDFIRAVDFNYEEFEKRGELRREKRVTSTLPTYKPCSGNAPWAQMLSHWIQSQTRQTCKNLGGKNWCWEPFQVHKSLPTNPDHCLSWWSALNNVLHTNFASGELRELTVFSVLILYSFRSALKLSIKQFQFYSSFYAVLGIKDTNFLRIRRWVKVHDFNMAVMTKLEVW